MNNAAQVYNTRTMCTQAKKSGILLSGFGTKVQRPGKIFTSYVYDRRDSSYFENALQVYNLVVFCNNINDTRKKDRKR